MPPFTVQFLCEYRPVWRDSATVDRWIDAVKACFRLHNTRRRPTRIIDDTGMEVYSLP